MGAPRVFRPAFSPTADPPPHVRATTRPARTHPARFRGWEEGALPPPYAWGLSGGA